MPHILCLSCLFYATPQVEVEASPDLHAIWLCRAYPLTAPMKHGSFPPKDGSSSSSSCVEPNEQMEDGALAMSVAPDCAFRQCKRSADRRIGTDTGGF